MVRRKTIKVYLGAWGDDCNVFDYKGCGDPNYIGELFINADWHSDWCWVNTKQLRCLLRNGVFDYADNNNPRLISWKSKEDWEKAVEKYFVECL